MPDEAVTRSQPARATAAPDAGESVAGQPPREPDAAIAYYKQALERRVAQLAIISDVGRAVAAELDFRTLIALVGDKIREVFDAQGVTIHLYERRTNLIHSPYLVQRGERLPSPGPRPPFGFGRHIIETRRPLVINQDLARRMAGLGPSPIGGEVGKSFLGVPVIFGDEVTGLITLQNLDREHAFSDADVDLLLTLASSLGVALRNARLFDETNRLLGEARRRAAELATVTSIGQALASQLELRALIPLVGDKMRETFDAQIVYVALYDRATNVIDFPYYVERGRPRTAPPLAFGRGLTSRIVQTRRPLLLNQDEHFRQVGVPRVGTPARSYLGVPILAGDEAIGVISVQSTEREGRFGEADVRLLTAIAASVGVAIQNARLFEEREARRRDLEHLYQLGTATQEVLSLKERLRLILRAVQEVVGFERAVIWLSTPDGQRLETTAWAGFDMPEGEPVRLPIEGGAPTLSRAYRERTEIILDGSRAVPEEYRVPERYRRIKLLRSRGPVVLPLISRGRCVGVLAVDNGHSHRAVAPNLDLLRTLAANAAAGIENARLYSDLQDHLARVEALSAVGTALVEERDLQRVLRTVAEQVIALLGAAGCAIVLLGHDEAARTPGEELELAVVVGTGEGGVQGQRMPLVGSFSGEAIRTGQPVVSDDARHDPRGFASAVRASGGTALLSVPLQTSERVVGAITVQDPRGAEGARRFGPRDVAILTLFAQQGAVVIENARLYAAARQELAERQRAEEALRESETLYRTLLESADDDIHVKDAQGRYIIVNSRIARRMGLRKEDFLGKTALEMYPGESGRKIRDDDLRVLQQGVSLETEDVHPTVIHHVRKVPLRNDAGEIVGMLTVSRDVTERKQAMESLRQQNEYLAALQETALGLVSRLELTDLLGAIIARAGTLTGTSNGAIWLLDRGADAMQLRVSVGVYRESVGARLRPEEGLAGKVWRTGDPLVVNDYQHWAGRASDPRFNMLRAVVGVPLTSGGQVVGVITLAHAETGHTFDDGVIAILTRFAQLASVALDNARLYAAAQQELAERTRAEEALRDSEQRLRTVIDNVPLILFEFDRQGVFTLSEGKGLEAVGRRPGQVVGQSIFEVYHDVPAIHDNARRALAGEAFTQVTEVAGKVFEIYYSPLTDQHGNVTSVSGVSSDVTERKRFEAELQQARAAAEAANRAKGAFLATMSHEIRTPMNAVIGMSGLLLTTGLTPEQREYAETIRDSGDTLLTIINDILDFSKIEAGRLELEQAPFDLCDCLEGALDLLTTQAAKKGLDLAYLLDDVAPTTVIGDVTRLRQILLNLLSNAVKFTEQGEVVLAVTARPLDDGRHELRFAVRDTGTGIPPDRLDRLFRAFSQGDASTTRKYGGTGLGLAISKRLSELMGGTMWVESKVGQGTTFRFTIVAEAAPDLVAHTHLRGEQPRLRGKRLLIVDDNATNRRIVVEQAKAWGMLPRDTASPAEALAWVRRGDPLDVAILDMQMPEMDGLALATAIRQYRDAQALPLVLFSSLGRREAGADTADFAAYLSKPLKPVHLYEALVGVVGAQPVPVRQVAETKPPLDPERAARLPLRILLAEDNAVNQKLALRLLGQLGYRADVAANGLEVLDALERQGYDVVLMDVQMPEMDGLAASRQICERWPSAERPRIIAMTANAMQGDREACLAAGMDDYVSKPIRVEELVAALSKCTSPA